MAKNYEETVTVPYNVPRYSVKFNNKAQVYIKPTEYADGDFIVDEEGGVSLAKEVVKVNDKGEVIVPSVTIDTSETAAVPKEYVDGHDELTQEQIDQLEQYTNDQLGKKLDKVSSSSSEHRLYSVAPDGTQEMLTADDNIIANVVVRRASDAYVYVPDSDGGKNTQAASKGFVNRSIDKAKEDVQKYVAQVKQEQDLDIEILTKIAEGKTRTVVISNQIGNGVNSAFVSTKDTFSIANPAMESIMPYNATGEDAYVVLSNLHVGDVVLVIETNVPDRWVSYIDDNEIRFSKLEIDLSAYYNKTQTDALLSKKLDKLTNTDKYPKTPVVQTNNNWGLTTVTSEFNDSESNTPIGWRVLSTDGSGWSLVRTPTQQALADNPKLKHAIANVNYVNNVMTAAQTQLTNALATKQDKLSGITTGSVELSEDSSAGCKGFYYKYIDFTHKEIYLTNAQVTPNSDMSLEVIKGINGYAVGDVLNIINKNHYELKSTITDIIGNRIKVDSLPFSVINTVDNLETEDYTISCPAKPDVGLVVVGYDSLSFGDGAKATGTASFAFGRDVNAVGNYAMVVGRDNTAKYASTVGGRGNSAGSYATSTGKDNTASGSYATTTGRANKATGTYSVAIGLETTAKGDGSVAEGYRTTASGNNSHAFGRATTASGAASHASGVRSTASGAQAVAEGMDTLASAANSHAQNRGTIAASEMQTALGKWNVKDTTGTYAEIVGNGTSNTNRSNARTLDWEGNEVLAGDLTINGYMSVADALAKKVNKVSNANSVYCTDGNGAQTTKYIANRQDNAIATFSEGGRLQTATPSQSYHCASKGYVDNLIPKYIDLSGDTTFTIPNYFAKQKVILCFASKDGEITNMGSIYEAISGSDTTTTPKFYFVGTDEFTALTEVTSFSKTEGMTCTTDAPMYLHHAIVEPLIGSTIS